eukprot:8934897-Karenia_brevis.AAC.1
MGDIVEADDREIGKIFAGKPKLTHGLVIGGAPCQPFSGLNACRKGFDDPRSDGITQFITLILKLKWAAPHIR